MYHVAPTEARPSIEQHGLDWRRLGLGGAYRPPGNYLWDSLEFALWYAQAYDDRGDTIVGTTRTRSRTAPPGQADASSPDSETDAPASARALPLAGNRAAPLETGQPCDRCEAGLGAASFATHLPKAFDLLALVPYYCRPALPNVLSLLDQSFRRATQLQVDAHREEAACRDAGEDVLA